MESACSGASLGDSGTHSDPEDRKVKKLAMLFCSIQFINTFKK
jgi:hypothetical protein